MKDIILDNIVFSLQKSGGISVVWQNLISNIICDPLFDVKLLEYKYSTDNIFRQNLIIDRNLIDKRNSNVHIERYLSPKIESVSPFIFHSSYYRVSNNCYAKNVTTVHDFTYERYNPHSIATRVHKWQKYKAIKNSEIIVCISENTRNDMFHYLPMSKRKNVHIIYNGVSEEYRIEPDHKDDRFKDYLLFVGARSGYKNFEFMIEAVANTKYKVLICGKPLSETETSYLDRKIGKERYIVRSNIPNSELNRIYNSVLCLIYPSSYEGFGIPVVEAQKAGCPVIAFNASSIPEIIGETPLLLDKLDANDLLRKIELTKDASVRAEIIESGIENSKRFSWRKMYEQYSQLYLQLSE